MVVLDASGSMNVSDAPGPRIAAAKKAVRTMVRGLPANARVGLEVYGTSTGSSDAEKAAGCKDIKILQPVADVDKAALIAKVDRIRARGYTPIGNALKRAAAALPAEGPRSIVLVSDGIDTCAPPDPCAVARQLKRSGVDLIVNTVGFKVDAKARAQLACIAAATGGSYHDANDGTSLTKQLHVRVSRAMKPYSVVGTPIAGSPTPAGAPQLRPGQYVDTYDPAPHMTDRVWHYYSVQLRRGETPYLSATLVPSARRTSGSILQTDIELTDRAESSTCSFNDLSQDVNLVRSLAPQTAVVSPGEVGGPSWPSGCPTHGTFLVKVARVGDTFADQPLPVELALRFEPPARTTGLPGPASARHALAPSVRGAAKKIESGDSYNDAPRVGTGVYRDTVVSGENRYVKVHLEWGQRLGYRIHFTAVPGLGAFDGVAAYSTLANPVRAEAEQAQGARVSAGFVGARSESVLEGSTPVPVRYANRNSSSTAVAAYAIDGDYYIAINTGFTNTGKPAITVPYTLTVQVFGKARTGPHYQPLPTPTPSATSARQRATSSAGKGGAPARTGAMRTADAVAGTSSGGTSITAIIAGVAAGVVIVAGLLGWFVWRRRAHPPATHV